MSQTRLAYLLQRYLENTASEEEIDEVMLHLDNKDNEEMIKTLMDQLSSEQQAVIPVFSSEKSKLMLAGILNENNQDVSVPFTRKRNWLYAAAAAVILLLGGAVLYKSTFTKTSEQNLAKSKIINTDIAPGGYKAVLTLADRSTIILDSAANGLLTRQGNTKIIKQDSGQIAYIPTIEKPGEILFNSITTPRGGQYRLMLPDGSRAWLNAASSLRFPAVFGETERKVELTGEVYFEVAENASKPFIVNVAGKGEVKVIGTRFNINAYDDEATVNTTLLEGRVKVTAIGSGASRNISPGEQVQLMSNGQLSLSKDVRIEQVMAWKNEMFDFSNADLPTILRQVSRWYDVDIAFEGSPPQKKFEGELPRNLTLSQVLRLLEKYDVHFKMEGRKLTVLK